MAHARHVHAEGGRIFLVGSADGRFAELAGLGRVELLVWDGQPVATKLADVVHHIHRLAHPTGAPADYTIDQDPPNTAAAAITPSPQPDHQGKLATRLFTAVVTGVGIAVGQRLLDVLLPRRKR